MAVGVLKAIDQAKRSDIKLVFGGAGAKGMIKTLMDGSDPRIQANVSYSPKFIYDAIKLTAEARLKGEKLPPKTIIPVGADHQGATRRTSTSRIRRSEPRLECCASLTPQCRRQVATREACGTSVRRT
jgi:hypothetical protein